MGAISEIVNGRAPGLKVCLALADYFNTSPEHILRLAGHLPPAPNPTDDPPELVDMADRCVAYLRKTFTNNPHLAERIVRMVELQAEITTLAANSQPEKEATQPKDTPRQ